MVIYSINYKVKGEQKMNLFKVKIIYLCLAIVLILGVSPTVLANESFKVTPWQAYPEKTVELAGFIEEKVDGEGYKTYVIEPNSDVKFNFNTGWLFVHSLGSSEDIREVVCDTVTFEKATRMDNSMWYDSESELIENEYIKKGATFKFKTPGKYELYFSLGYATRDERMQIQSNDELLSWQYSPTVIVEVQGDGGVDHTNIFVPNEDKELEFSNNKSEIKFTNWRGLDNGHEVRFNFENNSDFIDTSNYALVLFSEDSSLREIHFLDEVTLYPGKKVMSGFHTQFDAEYVLSNKAKLIIIKFDNNEDKERLAASIPPNNERNKAYGVDYVIDPYENGNKWFKDNFNIDMK
jgi:hypothetical protein